MRLEITEIIDECESNAWSFAKDGSIDSKLIYLPAVITYGCILRNIIHLDFWSLFNHQYFLCLFLYVVYACWMLSHMAPDRCNVEIELKLMSVNRTSFHLERKLISSKSFVLNRTSRNECHNGFRSMYTADIRTYLFLSRICQRIQYSSQSPKFVVSAFNLYAEIL